MLPATQRSVYDSRTRILGTYAHTHDLVRIYAHTHTHTGPDQTGAYKTRSFLDNRRYAVIGRPDIEDEVDGVRYPSSAHFADNRGVLDRYFRDPLAVSTTLLLILS